MKLQFVFALAILVKYAGCQCINSWPGAITSGTNITLCETCNGDCDGLNGCACLNGIDGCLPSVTKSCNDFSDATLCCPDNLYYSYNQSCCITTPTCVPECNQDETCNLGECECITTKFPNLTRDNFYREIDCESNVITVTVSKCQLESLGYNTSSMHLRDPSDDCDTSYEDVIEGQTMISYQVELYSNWCGNTITADDSNIYFTNSLFIGILYKPLITVNPISFNYTCAYKRTMQTSLQLPGNITTQTVQLSGVNGTGSYPLTMAAYKDVTMTVPYTNNDEVVVGSDIFIGMFVTDVDGSIYVLRVETCIASPTDNRSDPNAFALIVNGCPQETVSTTIMENGDALEAAFRISSFQFQNYLNVFVSCDVRLCVNSTGVCSKCSAGKSLDTATNEVKVNLNMAANYDYLEGAGTHTAASWAMLAGIQLAIAFMKFY